MSGIILGVSLAEVYNRTTMMWLVLANDSLQDQTPTKNQYCTLKFFNIRMPRAQGIATGSPIQTRKRGITQQWDFHFLGSERAGGQTGPRGWIVVRTSFRSSLIPGKHNQHSDHPCCSFYSRRFHSTPLREHNNNNNNENNMFRSMIRVFVDCPVLLTTTATRRRIRACGPLGSVSCSSSSSSSPPPPPPGSTGGAAPAPPGLSAEEAGRRASDRADADDLRRRNERLRRLADAADRVGDDGGERSPATLLAHAGIEAGGVSSPENFPMSPPLHTATTYTRPPDGIYKEG